MAEPEIGRVLGAEQVFGPRDPIDQTAVEENHDADIPSNAGWAKGLQPRSVDKRSLSDHIQEHDFEKGERISTSDAGNNAAETGMQDRKEADVTETTKDPLIIDWDGPNDPENPLNWSKGKKTIAIFTLSMLTLVTPLASSMFAPGVPSVLQDFHTDSQILAEFVVSVYILGFAVGPLLISPLSEVYGRYPVYVITYFLFLVFTIACAVASNMGMLIAFRFLSGCFGVTPVTIGGGTIADLFPADRRGAVMAIWAMGPLLGPVIGPVCGGYLSGSLGWRWVFWIIAIISGVLCALCALFTSESYAPVILQRKTLRLRKQTGNPDLRSKLDNGLTPSALLQRSIIRPSKMLLYSPIVMMMSLYMSVIYGLLYLLFTTFTFVFEDNYGFSENDVGLVYIGMGAGMLIGLLALGLTSDRISKSLAARYNNGTMKPEYRLPPLIFGGLFVPIGMFIYGWCTDKHVQWAVPLLGTLLVGIGIITAFMCIQTYLIDAFTIYAASAIAANTVLRSIFGAFLPLAGLDMYAALGLGWGNSLLGFVALALIPIPALFYIYGERIRNKYKVQF